MEVITFETAAGRTFILALERDECLLESVEKVVKDYEIDSAVVTSGIGTLSRFHYHRVTNVGAAGENEFLVVEGPLELLSTQGTIAGGAIHLHAVCSDLERVYCGHVEDGCKALYVLEVSIQEIPGARLTREPVAETGRRMLRQRDTLSKGC